MFRKVLPTVYLYNEKARSKGFRIGTRGLSHFEAECELIDVRNCGAVHALNTEVYTYYAHVERVDWAWKECLRSDCT